MTTPESKYKIALKENLVYFLFFLPYTGTGIPAYIVCLLYMFVRIKYLRFKLADIFFLAVILVWFVSKLLQSDPGSASILLRYYFGLYIFYLFFNNFTWELDVEKLLMLICGAVIVEAVLVNTIINPAYLPNYPKSSMNGIMNFETNFFGFYQRPYCIGNNASITGTIIMVLVFTLDYIKKQQGLKISFKIMTLATAAIILLASGVGFMLYLLFHVLKVQPFKNMLRAIISIFTLLLMYILIFVVDIGGSSGFEKISALYINFLIEFKTGQVETVFSKLQENNSLWIGMPFTSPVELIVWGDFAWNDLFFCTGYIGLFTTVLLLLVKANRYNKIPVLIFALATFHYSAMYALPGQMLVGYFFSSKFKFFMQETMARSGISFKRKRFTPANI